MVKSNFKKEIFDKEIIKISKNKQNNKLLNRHKQILEYIYKYCGKDDYILDVGCFDGKILKILEKSGYKNLYGLDFSDISNKSFIGSKIYFKYYDIEQDKIPFNNKFDAIIYSDVLEHLFSPEKTLSDIKSNLTKNGKIFFSVPNASWFLNGVLLSFFPSKLYLSTAFGPWGHSYHFTFYNLKIIARNLGFEIIHLSGGKMDNYIFNTGFKKILYESFLMIIYTLAQIFPKIFSDHIFGVFENSGK